MSSSGEVSLENLASLESLAAHLKKTSGQFSAIPDLVVNPFVCLAIVSYPDFAIVMANSAYRSITPHPEIEPMGRTIEEIWPPAEGYSGTGGLQRVVEIGEVISAERVEVHYHTGQMRYLDIRVERMLWNDQPAALMLLRENTAERVVEALRSSEERFAKAFRTSPDGLVISLKNDGRIIDANPGFEQIFGYPREESLGKTTLDLHLFPDPAARQAMLETLQARGSVRDQEQDVPTKTGITRHITISVENINIANQACLLKIIHDITERKTLEQSLQQAEIALLRMNQELEERVQERTHQLQEANETLHQQIHEREQAQIELRATTELFARLFDAAPDPTFLIDPEGRIRRLNHQASKTFGYAAEELQGQMVEILLAKPLRQKHRALRSQYWENPVPHPMGLNGDIVTVTKEGKAIPVDITLNPVQIGGNVLAICVLHDISHQKQLADELAEVQRRLMDSVEIERRRLAQDLHDGPMQEIYGLIYQLADWGNEEGQPTAETGEEIQRKLNEINETLRAISRDLRPPAVEFGLEKAIREHAGRFQQEHNEVKLDLTLMPDGHTLPEPVRITLFRIYQVALTNVLRHAHAQQVAVRFHFDHNQILLEIQDDGQGFVVPKRWVRFAREGHLGLVSAVERVEAIGGRLEVESAIDHGTCVRAIIPQTSLPANPQS